MKDHLHKGMDTAHPLTRKDNYGRFGRIGAPSARERNREEVLADWLGEERTPGVFAKWHAEPHKAASLVEAILENVHPEEINLLDQIRMLWEKIVGGDASRQLVPLSVNEKLLTIGFFHSAWRFAMDTPVQKQVILQRIHELTGIALGEIRFAPTSPNKSH